MSDKPFHYYPEPLPYYIDERFAETIRASHRDHDSLSPELRATWEKSIEENCAIATEQKLIAAGILPKEKAPG